MLNVIPAEMTVLLEISWEKTLTHRGFFSHSEEIRRVQITVKKGFCREEDHFCSIALKFGSRMSDAMGLIHPPNYTIFGPPGKLCSDGSIDFVLLYADCVAPAGIGGQRVNLLKAMSMVKTGGLDFHHAVKP